MPPLAESQKKLTLSWRTAAGLAAAAVLIAVAVVGFLWWQDATVRETVIAAREKLKGFVDMEGEVSSGQKHRPSPAEVQQLMGIPPVAPANPLATRSVEEYNWKSPLKEYRIIVAYTRKGTESDLKMQKAKVYGNPDGVPLLIQPLVRSGANPPATASHR